MILEAGGGGVGITGVEWPNGALEGVDNVRWKGQVMLSRSDALWC